MTSSDFLSDSRRVFVADASVLINLNATECAREIIRALPGLFVATENAMAELAAGARKGHPDAESVRALVGSGDMRIVELGESGYSAYLPLIDGAAEQTLDDGEAATIAYAHEVGGVAVIDERKARTLCAVSFRRLALCSTVDILTHQAVELALGRELQALAVRRALRNARMQVPQHQVDAIVSLIGAEEAASCPSLPRMRRPRESGEGV